MPTLLLAIFLAQAPVDGDCNQNGVPDAAELVPSRPGLVLRSRKALPEVGTVRAAAPPVLTEVDGDGKLDAVLLLESFPRLLFLRGRGDGSFEAPLPISVPEGLRSFVFVDLDRDGLPDLAATSPFTLSIFRGVGGGRFEPAQSFTIGSDPREVTAGDFHGDGLPDVATSNDLFREEGGHEEATSVSVFRNDGTGRLAGPRNYLLGVQSDGTFETWDYDADGDQDLLCSHNPVSVLMNDGAGAFSSIANLPSGDRRIDGELADMDGDGDADVLVQDGEKIWLLVNDGGGALRIAGVASSTTYVRTALAGDLDGDGLPDVLVLSMACPPGVLLFSNEGSLRFRDGQNLEWPASSWSIAAAADLDSDGHTEIVALDRAGYLSVHSLAIRSAASDCDSNGVPDDCEIDCNTNGYPDACDLAAGAVDCDSDGIPDDCELDCDGDRIADACEIARGTAADCNRNGTPDECEVSDRDQNGVPDDCEIAAGTAGDCNRNGIVDAIDLAPTFHLEMVRNYAPVGWNPWTGFAADLDGDGDLDLLSAGYGAGIFWNAGADFEARPIAFAAFDSRAETQFQVADVDSDGDVDLGVLLLGTSSGCDSPASSVLLLENVGRGRFVRTGEIPAEPETHSFSFAELSGDGEIDVAFLAAGGVSVRAGRGRFSSLAKVLEAPIADASLIAADLTGDGRPDLAGSAGLVLRNEGGGTFVRLPPFPALGRSLMTRDFDGDGDQDILTAVLALNDGAGRFRLGFGELQGGTNYPAAAGDLDGDGDLDIVADRCEAGLDLERNDGKASFTPAGTYPLGCMQSLVAADLNGDARADLASFDFGLLVVLNRGDGTFEAPQETTLVEAKRISCPGMEDVNGDSRVDLVFLKDGGIAWLRGEADGRFVESPSLLPEEEFLAAQVVDLDGDEHPDLLLSSEKEVSAAWNAGDGSFADRRTLSFQAGLRLVPADFNGDRLLDVVFNAPGGCSTFIAFQGPSRSFAQPSGITALGCASDSTSAADFDGDGDLDLAIAGSAGGVTIFANDGEGRFHLALQFEVDGAVFSSAAGDLDGDLAAELLLSTSKCPPCDDGDCRCDPFLNVLSFQHELLGQELTAKLGLEGVANAMKLADLDLDGDLDVLYPEAFADRTSGDTRVNIRLAILLNDGEARLRIWDRHPTSYFPDCPLAGDVDGDRYPEIIYVGERESRFEEPGEFQAQLLTLIPNRTVPPRSVDMNADGIPDECGASRFRRGDVDGDGRLVITDPIRLLGALFLGDATLPCEDAADSDDDGALALTDAVRILLFLFQAGPAPPLPGPDACGEDPTADRLGQCRTACR